MLIKLLSKYPESRLGTKNITHLMDHKFFDGVNWDQVKSQTMKPPYTPTISFIERNPTAAPEIKSQPFDKWPDFTYNAFDKINEQILGKSDLERQKSFLRRELEKLHQQKNEALMEYESNASDIFAKRFKYQSDVANLETEKEKLARDKADLERRKLEEKKAADLQLKAEKLKLIKFRELIIQENGNLKTDMENFEKDKADLERRKLEEKKAADELLEVEKLKLTEENDLVAQEKARLQAEIEKLAKDKADLGRRKLEEKAQSLHTQIQPALLVPPSLDEHSSDPTDFYEVDDFQPAELRAEGPENDPDYIFITDKIKLINERKGWGVSTVTLDKIVGAKKYFTVSCAKPGCGMLFKMMAYPNKYGKEKHRTIDKYNRHNSRHH